MKFSVQPFSTPSMMKTKTSMFLNILVKTCFLPITLKNDQIVFKLFSMKSLIFTIYTFGLYFGFMAINFMNIKIVFHSNTSFVERMTTIVLSLSYILAYSMPLSLSVAMSKMDRISLSWNTLLWPDKGIKILMVIFGSFTGATLNDYLGGQLINIWNLDFGIIMLIIYIMINTLFFLGWFLPILIVAIFLQDLMNRVNGISVSNFGPSVVKILEDYSNTHNSLQNFLLLWFTTLPCIVIFVLFMAFSSMMKSVDTSWEKAIADVSLIGGTICSFSSVLLFSGVLDETYQKMLCLRKKIHERLYNATDNAEVKLLEFCKNEAELVRPFNAAGYFEIDKTTWTSIMSFR